MKNKNLSFDFDKTLSKEDVQEYAKELITRGYTIWIVTSRYSNEEFPKYARSFYNYNQDLFEVADRLGIQREHIIFANMEYKYPFIQKFNPIFHLDDDHIELDGVRHNTNTWAVDANYSDYREQCEQALAINENT